MAYDPIQVAYILYLKGCEKQGETPLDKESWIEYMAIVFAPSLEEAKEDIQSVLDALTIGNKPLPRALLARVLRIAMTRLDNFTK